jgi:hypothetical protein
LPAAVFFKKEKERIKIKHSKLNVPAVCLSFMEKMTTTVMIPAIRVFMVQHMMPKHLSEV